MLQPPDHRGVYAVPPVARRDDEARAIHADENLRVLRHIASGGVRRILYGGNGNLYNMTLGDYEALLECLDGVPDDVTIVPSVGPAYGRAVEQAEVLRRFAFPFVMALPGNHPRNASGLETGYREIAQAAGIPMLLYIKSEENFGTDREAGLDVIGRLVDDGTAVGIKYAIVRDDPARDAYLEELLARVDRDYVISGLGERPAVVHMQKWNLPGFTTGSGCVNPALVQALYEAAAGGEFHAANEHRKHFMPLEDLRDRWGPVTVLHEAVEAAGIATIGPHYPFDGPLSVEQQAQVERVSRDLAAAFAS